MAEQLVVLEKSQFIDKEKLQKYLKGRQHEGSADNLPMVADPPTRQQEPKDEFDQKDRELVYRALVELRNDIADMKKMFANFLYSTFSQKNMKALPASVREEVDKTEVSPSNSNIDLGDHATLGMQSMPGEAEIDDTEEPEILDFLQGDEIPSIEDAEKFLIQQALKRFDGNRRKASETLGVSERTLYRKLDQYGLD